MFTEKAKECLQKPQNKPSLVVYRVRLYRLKDTQYHQSAIDGHFADLKNKLRNPNGLSVDRKKKFIDEFLKA